VNHEDIDTIQDRDTIEIDLREIIAVLKKWRWLIALITALSVLSAGIISFFILPPVFEATTTLMVQQANQPQTRYYTEEDIQLGEAVAEMSRLPALTINNVVRQIKNPEIMKRVAKELKLDPELYTPEAMLGMIEVEGSTNPNAKDANSMVDIKVQHTDPRLAARIANSIRENYLAFVSEKNTEQMAKSATFLSQQLAEAEKKVDKLSDELKKFDEQPRGVLFLEKEIQSKLDTLNQYRTKANELSVEYEKALAAQRMLEEKLSQTPQLIKMNKLQVDGTVAQVEEINPVYTSLSETLNQKTTEVTEMEAQLGVLGMMTASLEEELNSLQAEYTDKKTKRDRIVQELDLANNTYKLLSEKSVQTRITKSVDLGQTSFITVAAAEPPSQPVKPKKVLNMTVAAVLGLMVSVMLAFVLNYLDNTIKTQDDVQRILGLPVIGTVPER